MTDARQLLRGTDLLLLDFDGPVTKLLPPPSNTALTDSVRNYALDLNVQLTPEEMETSDHLSVVRAAYRGPLNVASSVEEFATNLEISASKTSPITPCIEDLLSDLATRRTPVVIVTNNSPRCVDIFLEINELSGYVAAVIGRHPLHINYMKPSSWMILHALRLYSHRNPVMLGDSTSDALAAQAAGIPCIGLAKNSARATELLAAGANCTVNTIGELVQ